MKNSIKKAITIVTTGLMACSIFAASPKASISMNGALGAYNINKNPIISEVPGLSDKSDLSFKFGLEGSFGKESGYRSAGYSVGGFVDIKSLLNKPTGDAPAYTSDSKKTNNYTKIQKMIDWYEANKHFYGLPDNPYSTGHWPTTEYANKKNMKQFIYGTNVENIYDVDWNSSNNVIRIDGKGYIYSESISAFTAASELYNDIKRTINIALKKLYIEPEYGNVPASTRISEAEYMKLDAKGRKYAQKKMEAVESFNRLANDNVQRPSFYGYANITNIAGLFDINVNILGAHLNSGKLITSRRAGQNDFGTAVSLGIARGLVDGLDASLTFAVSGGKTQNPENFNTEGLDYYSGEYAEVGLKVSADYTYKLTDPALDITLGMDYVMPDLLIASTNNAGSIRAGVHLNDHREYINEYGFYLVKPSEIRNLIEVEDNFEFTYVYTKDRNDIYDKASMSYGLKNELYFSAYGAELRFDTSYKAPKFENKYHNQIEDRFAGKTAKGDFNAANNKDAVLFELDGSFNTFRLLESEILTVNAGLDALLYGGKRVGLGFNVGLACNLVDYVGKDLTISANMDWYKNPAKPEYEDTKNLTKNTFMDYTVITAGMEYAPYKNLLIGLDFETSPSPSMRYRERITSVEAYIKISY